MRRAGPAVRDEASVVMGSCFRRGERAVLPSVMWETYWGCMLVCRRSGQPARAAQVHS